MLFRGFVKDNQEKTERERERAHSCFALLKIHQQQKIPWQ